MTAAEFRLPPRLVRATAAALWRRHADDARDAARFDGAALEAVDGAGLALLLSWIETNRAARGRPPALVNLPPALRALAAAHRVSLPET